MDIRINKIKYNPVHNPFHYIDSCLELFAEK
jgi:hypothetical protein